MSLVNAGVCTAQAADNTGLEPVSASVFVMTDSPAGVNSVVVITDRDVVLIDTQVTPGLAEVLLDRVALVTDLAVRYAINTHWHVDHSHGNRGIRDLVAGVEIVAHRNAGEAMLERGAEQLALWPEYLRSQAPSDASGRISETMERVISEVSEFDPELPSLLIEDRMVISRSGMSVEVIHPGPGHTDGDLVVFLPGERVLISGDLLLGFTDHPLEYAATLRRVLDLPFETVVPGHGGVELNPRPRILAMAEEMEEIVATVRRLRSEGLTADEAVTRVAALGLRGLIGRQERVVTTIYTRIGAPTGSP